MHFFRKFAMNFSNFDSIFLEKKKERIFFHSFPLNSPLQLYMYIQKSKLL